MDKPHLYSSNGDSWQPHPTLPGIKVQSLENRATWSEASVTIVEVAPAGVIVEHRAAWALGVPADQPAREGRIAGSTRRRPS